MIDIKLIKKLMVQRDMGVMELSREAELSHTAVGNLLKGDGDPKLSTLIAVARVLRISVSEIIGESKDNKPPSYIITVPKSIANDGELEMVVKFV